MDGNMEEELAMMDGVPEQIDPEMNDTTRCGMSEKDREMSDLSHKLNGDDHQTKTKLVSDLPEKKPKYQAPLKSKAPDGGYGWVIVFASFIGHFFLVGMSRSMGVVYVALLEKFNGTALATAMVISLYNIMRMVLGPVASILAGRYSCRICLIVGSIIACFGCVLAAQATELYHVHLGYGVLSGMGSSLIFTPMYIITGKYFDKKKGIAMSVSTVGSGFGAMVLAVILSVFVYEYALSGTMLLLGAMHLQCAVAGAMFRPLEIQGKVEPTRKSTESLAVQTKSRLMSCLSTFSVLRNRVFLLYGTNCMAIPFCVVGSLTFLPALALERGCTPTQASTLLAIAGLSDVVGRLGSGFVFDTQAFRHRRRLPHSIMGIAAGACVFSWGLMPGYYSLAVMVAVWGIFEGGFHGQRVSVVSEFVPSEEVPLAVGMCIFFQGIGNLVCPLTGALLKDTFNTYTLCYFYFGTFIMTACGLFLLQYLVSSCMRGGKPRKLKTETIVVN